MGEIEEVVEQQEPKKVEDIIKRYMESQQELMVLRMNFLTVSRRLTNTALA